MARPTRKVAWNPEYYLNAVLAPKRRRLLAAIEAMHSKRNDDFHGIQARAAYYCEIALKSLIAVLGQQPPPTHNLNTLYAKAERAYNDVDRTLDPDVQQSILTLTMSCPALKGAHFAEPSKVMKTAANYYKKARYPKAVPLGHWSDPQLDPLHLFAVGDGVAATASSLLRSSAASTRWPKKTGGSAARQSP